MQDLNRLLALVAVAETGSISAAAARLGYTPPALSQQMAKLEREARMPLLVRHRRGARLTAAGELLVQRTREIDEILRTAELELMQFQDMSGGHLRIGSFTTGGIHLLPPVLAELRGRHPGIAISMQEFEPPEGYDPLVEGEIDLLLTHSYLHGHQHPVPAGLCSETLLDEELVLVAEAGHPLMSDDSPLHWSELAGVALISGRPGLANREALEALFSSRSMAPPLVAFETSNYSVACALASSGVGAACVPRMAADASPAPISTRRFASPALHRTVSLLWRSSDNTPLLRTARRMLQKAFAHAPGDHRPVPDPVPPGPPSEGLHRRPDTPVGSERGS
ncbi:LysR family transcriptional regulator [Streptomyces violaceochromogenes]|uniref:LysR family transcriptional regulator n=1 Tax=Streptomyces violaceochromogenes TaxID=67377 RepID=A0ABU6LU86_9ACTN|nr:LysR family transcriptional regulator [Streptomyces violaceochromogenes]MEC7052192.1 LysR family transcriptional regulator [Streptomyces violaceochromogenes]GHC81363.1 LysR family transcriptional regulator [Streptomyces violaceochromogenes]